MVPKPWLFFFSKIPSIVYYPQSPPRIFSTSDELLFPDFWYSHVTEKKTLRREKCNMRKKQDIMWEQSTLWELVEKWVTKYLNSYHTLFY